MTSDDHVPRRAVLAADAKHLGPEVALMRRVAAGVPEAQEELAERLVMRVRRGAHALMRGSADADDSAQLALIEILRSAHNYSGRSSVGTLGGSHSGPQRGPFCSRGETSRWCVRDQQHGESPPSSAPDRPPEKSR